jgi:hypothetical protein
MYPPNTYQHAETLEPVAPHWVRNNSKSTLSVEGVRRPGYLMLNERLQWNFVEQDPQGLRPSATLSPLSLPPRKAKSSKEASKLVGTPLPELTMFRHPLSTWVARKSINEIQLRRPSGLDRFIR